MSRNVEIKARAADLASIRGRARRLAGSDGELIHQTDTFFEAAHGRLKVRTFADGSGEIIRYERPDQPGPKTSTYTRVGCEHGSTLAAIISRVLPLRGTVVKTREVFLIGRARVHLDQVATLGTFVELEVILEDGEPVASGEREARELMNALGIPDAALVGEAYIDLLERGNRRTGAPIVRLGTHADVPAVMALATACIAAMRRRGIEQWDEIYPDRATFLGDAEAGALYVVPGDAGGLDGAFTLDERQSPEYADVPWTIVGRRITVVHRLMVHPSRQGQGLARQLMHQAERRAVELGFGAVRLDAFTLNPAALRLYRSLGYHDAGSVTFRKGVFRCFEKAL